jgi:hypothetical protein
MAGDKNLEELSHAEREPSVVTVEKVISSTRNISYISYALKRNDFFQEI